MMNKEFTEMLSVIIKLIDLHLNIYNHNEGVIDVDSDSFSRVQSSFCCFCKTVSSQLVGTKLL